MCRAHAAGKAQLSKREMSPTEQWNEEREEEETEDWTSNSDTGRNQHKHVDPEQRRKQQRHRNHRCVLVPWLFRGKAQSPQIWQSRDPLSRETREIQLSLDLKLWPQLPHLSSPVLARGSSPCVIRSSLVQRIITLAKMMDGNVRWLEELCGASRNDCRNHIGSLDRLLNALSILQQCS